MVMSDSSHLLLVEDDSEISKLISRFMAEYGFRVSVAADGRAMDRILDTSRIDLILLDIMLPGEDGLSLCRRLRTSSAIPIIILTALGDDTDRIVGLEMGADDYLSKPFNPRELLARVRAVLRRGTSLNIGRADQSAALSFDGWHIDLGLRILSSPAGLQVALTSGEFDLLVVFCQHSKRVLSREQLLDLTHGRAAAPFDRAIDIQVSRLRRKIETDPGNPTLVKTVRFGGYVFTPNVVRES
jgi:two-component system, OmpR family, response regulator